MTEKLDSNEANRVRELRGDEPALLVGGPTAPTGQIDAETLWWLQDAINTMAEGGNQSHVRFLQRLHDTLSAQPPPGAQGDFGAKFEKTWREAADIFSISRAAAQHIWNAALAARQPVGEPVAWVHEEDPARVISARQKATALRDQGASGSSVRPYSVPAYLHAPPAQAVDLGAVRDAVQGITLGFDGDLPYIRGIAEALALIDKAVGK